MTTQLALLSSDTTVRVILLDPNGNSYLNGGNVGIGAANPNYRLDVGGSVGIANNNGGNANRLNLASGVSLWLKMHQ